MSKSEEKNVDLGWSLTLTGYNQNEQNNDAEGQADGQCDTKDEEKESPGDTVGDKSGTLESHKTNVKEDRRSQSESRKVIDLGESESYVQATGVKVKLDNKKDEAVEERKNIVDKTRLENVNENITEPDSEDGDTETASPELASPATRHKIQAQISEVRTMRQSVAHSVQNDSKDVTKFGVLPPITTQTNGKMTVSNQKVPEKSLASSVDNISVKAPINTPTSVNGASGKVQHIYVRFPGQRTGQMVL